MYMMLIYYVRKQRVPRKRGTEFQAYLKGNLCDHTCPGVGQSK